MSFPSAMFTGPGLAVESAYALSSTVVRVTFTADPLQVSPGGTHDALNPANYVVSGPSGTWVSSIASVGSDPQSVDVTLGAAMAPGTWTVTCANIETPTSTPLIAPFSASFLLVVAPIQPPISNGRANDDAFQVLIQFIGQGVGVYQPGWQALLFALAQGDQYNWDSAEDAWNERFISTADTIYLSYLGASYGVTRPLNLGLTDELYRQLIIALKTNKLTESAFLGVLKIFYGVDAVSASSTTALSEPFNISVGMQLDVTIDSRFPAIINFANDSFQIPGQASAIELAAAITESFDNQSISAYAIVHPSLGLNYVRIYSVAKGGSSAVQITGGQAQDYLQFPTLLVSADTTATWAVTQPSYGVSRFTTTGATTVDLSLAAPGDYVNVFGPNFPAADRGSFPITNIYVTYPGAVLTQAFDVDTLGYTQAGIPISAPADLMIFRSTKSTSFTTTARSVIVSSQGPNQVDVVIPATTQAVNRTEATGAYLQNPILIPKPTNALISNGEVTLTFASAHGLQTGAQITIDGIRSYPIFNPSGSTPNSFPVKNASIPPAGDNLPGQSASNLVTNAYILDATLDYAFAQFGTVTALDASNTLIAGGGDGNASTSNKANVLTVLGTTNNADGSTALNYQVQPITTMSASRQGQSAVLLPSGKVLCSGGWSGSTYLNTSDIYDPVAKTWTAGPTLNHARAIHQSVLLPNGLVLIVGGSTSDTVATATCELYDPVANTFTLTGSMAAARTMFSAILLTNGLVLTAGGSDGGNTYWGGTIGNGIITAELYDPVAATWSATGDMALYRVLAFMKQLPSGLVWTISELADTSPTGGSHTPAPNYEFYNPIVGRWSVGAQQFFVSQISGIDYLEASNTGIAICNSQLIAFSFSHGSTRQFGVPVDNITQNSTSIRINTSPPMWVYSANAFYGTPSNDIGLITFEANITSGLFNGTYTVSSVPTGLTLTYALSNPSTLGNWSLGNITNAAITSASAGASQWPGPYIFDPQNGVAITSIQTTTTATYSVGNQYSSLAVADASIFPNALGYICLAFGLSNQIASLKCYGQQDATHLLVDFSQVFAQTIPSGSTVTLLDGRGPFVPARNVPVGQFWLTDSPAGRAGAQNAIGEVEAAGVTVDISVTYPGDRGLGAEGYPTTGIGKQSDIVEVFSENYEGVE